jgi:hypothetical protein
MALIESIRIKNFKGIEEVSIPLEDNVVFAGPNNSGKTTALQALALWHLGARKWLEKRGSGRVPKQRPGVTINRRDLIAIPTPSAILLWRDLRVRRSSQGESKKGTKNISIEIGTSGTSAGSSWSCDLEFDYANEESLYCRSIIMDDGSRKEVPQLISDLKIAYLPPMSGLASHEKRLDRGAIDVLIGEGRTAEVLRNTCYEVFSANQHGWEWIQEKIEKYFGSRLNEPKYLQERGEIEMSFINRTGAKLDLSSAGRGQQQTLLILSYMTANPGSILLLDEPDAHLEILRQRQIYELISETASNTGGQVISASHSEVILKKAAEENTVIAFVGSPHILKGNSSHVDKALKSIGYEQYLLAEEVGWILYLEGETDLRALKAFSAALGHPSVGALESCFPSFVCNQPSKAKEHFYAIQGGYPNLRAIAIFDKLEQGLESSSPSLAMASWTKKEIENYFCSNTVLVSWAEKAARERLGVLYVDPWIKSMEEALVAVGEAINTMHGLESLWDSEQKASETLEIVFREFFKRANHPNDFGKGRYWQLIELMKPEDIDIEVKEMLDKISAVANPIL